MRRIRACRRRRRSAKKIGARGDDRSNNRLDQTYPVNTRRSRVGGPVTWVRLRSMGVDRGEVEPSSDEEDHGFHRLEASVSTRLALGGLKEAVDGFDEAIGLAGLGPGDDAVEMTADHDGDILHRIDLGAQDIGAPLFQHGGYDVDLLAIENVTQLLAIEPCARGAFCSELPDEPVEVGCLLVGELTSILEQRPA